MQAYIIRRFLLIIPTLLLASILVFSVIRLIPGSAVDVMVSRLDQRQGTTEGQRELIMKELGLDVPIYVQYGRWIGDMVLHGSLGYSMWEQTSVSEEIFKRFPITLELVILGLATALLISFPIGIYSAIRQDTIGDYIARSFAIACIAVPFFWVGTLVIVFPSIWWGWTPPILYTDFVDNPIENLKQVILPAIIMGMVLSGVNMRMMRTMMLEVLRQDYIRTAWAKGLRERVIVMRHALRSALIPVITILGLQIPVLIGGTVIIEQIFVLPGLGSLLVGSAFSRDYTTLSGVVFILAIGILITNLIVDLTYGFLDPRVRYQ